MLAFSVRLVYALQLPAWLALLKLAPYCTILTVCCTAIDMWLKIAYYFHCCLHNLVQSSLSSYNRLIIIIEYRQIFCVLHIIVRLCFNQYFNVSSVRLSVCVCVTDVTSTNEPRLHENTREARGVIIMCT